MAKTIDEQRRASVEAMLAKKDICEFALQELTRHRVAADSAMEAALAEAGKP